MIQVKTNNNRPIIYSCVSGSPLQEDSLAGSPYVLSVSSPEHSPSSFPSPSTGHLIYRNDHDLREPEDDPHTVPSPFFSFFFLRHALFAMALKYDTKRLVFKGEKRDFSVPIVVCAGFA